ncbi:MAG: glycosyltransferase involved in cell wall biosynthesis [Arenicella sp.]|jgi:glycosyltransferase involved in cell wall biosynthesis
MIYYCLNITYLQLPLKRFPNCMERIILYTNTFPPEFGAAPSRLFDMAKALQNEGHEVLVFTSIPNYPKGKIHPDYKEKFICTEDFEGIRVIRHWQFPSHSNRFSSRFATMFSLLLSMFFTFGKAISFKPTVVLFQYPPVAVPLVANFCAWISKSKLIMNASDLWSFALADLEVSNKKSILSTLVGAYEKWLFKKSDLILAQSEESLDFLKAGFAAKAQLYRTGVDCELFEQKENYQVGEKLKIVYVGVLGMAHGLLEVCKQINFASLNSELHIFGDGFEQIEIQKYLSTNSNRDIFLHSSVKHSEVPTILAQHDVALIPQKANIYGTFPAKTYEAMAVGLPILFHGGEAGAKLISSQNIGLISKPMDWSQLRLNILEMSQFNSEQMQEMGNKSREIAENLFDRRRIATDFASLLSENLTG